MLQLTKRTEYGLLALTHMAEQDGRVVSAREIGERFPIPRRLLAEVLKDLGRAGLIESQRGATGGYTLVRTPDAITLAEIVGALEGSPALSNCDSAMPEHDGTCGVAPTCPIRSPLHRIREGIWGHMERTTLRSLVRPTEPVEMTLAFPRSLPVTNTITNTNPRTTSGERHDS
jgi:Rrf2 family protein